MVRSFGFRLTSAIILGILPAALALAVLAGHNQASPALVGGVVGLGVVIAGLLSWSLARSWNQRVERLNALADALASRTLPSHPPSEGADAMSIAEQRLIAAADSIIKESSMLAEQSAEFETILRSMSEAVVLTGARREVMLLNRAAYEMFGLSGQVDYRGHDLVELCRDPRLQDFVRRVGAPHDGEPVTGEVLMQLPAPRTLEASAAPLPRNPSAAARVFVFRDISRLKSYETMRSDFISNITHELRTPLTALYGYAETLQKGVDDPATQQRFLNIIERQSRRLARLLDDLVSLSDLERGLTPLKSERLNAARVLEEAAELMVEEARRRGVDLEVKPPSDHLTVLGDRDRLHQVFVNLLDNAIKFTPRGGCVSLHAGSSRNGAEPAGVELAVADTGEGIPASHIPRLTERFYRVDRARSRELGGTGLGLAIVKHIVQLHHGHLKIESRVREGTTVKVWLPMAPPLA